jgi:myo-inositol 2-dehydrogenase/D-chiro-inositol 1-dehydrogenase
MTNYKKPRLRFFEESPGQRHIVGPDRYLYDHGEPRYRLAIIGTGTIGQEHMRVARLLGCASVHGVYDQNDRSATVAIEEFVGQGGAEPVRYRDLTAACNDADVDALMICTPNHTHAQVFDVAAKSGKPIFLEKPMATTVADARRIVEIAREYPAFVQVGLQYRYKAPYVEAQHEVRDRRSIGDVKTISMCEYRPPFLDKVEQWNKFAEFTGGTLVEKCCHYFDLMNLFAEATPARVFASAGQAVNFVDFEHDGKTADIDDHAFVVVEYKNGVRGNFVLNMFSPHFVEELVICGDHGRLVASERFDFLQDDSALSSVSIERGEEGASRVMDVSYARAIEQSGHHGATFFEHIAFVDQLDGKTSNAATPLQGLWSIVVAAAAQESAATGQPVLIDAFIEQNDLQQVLEA